MNSTTYLKGVLYGERGDLYAISHKQRLPLARCKPEITLYEKVTRLNVLGSMGRKEKRVYCAVAFCPEPEILRDLNDDFIRSISDIELVFDLCGANAVTETIKISGLTNDDLDYDGDLTFTADLSHDLAGELLRLLRELKA
jgi:hypothetical protein